jgi:hypothetical protein
MITLQYKVLTAWVCAHEEPETSFVRVTDDAKDNVITMFHGKEYLHTISQKDIKKIIKIIDEYPEIFEIPESLEPNDVLDGSEYIFKFADGVRSNEFSGFNILDYGRKPRKNATLALRVARRIKEEVLMDNKIRTMIPSRLQHWPKYRKPSNIIII